MSSKEKVTFLTFNKGADTNSKLSQIYADILYTISLDERVPQGRYTEANGCIRA
jgi:hypothetical protein